MRMNYVIKLIAITIFIFFISSCSNLGKVKLNFKAAKNINVDLNNNSLPLYVKCYQLKDDKKFLRANFNELWKKDQEILSNDLITSNEYLILPNKNYSNKICLLKPARYIGCIGHFNTVEENKWKIIKNTPGRAFIKPLDILISSNRLLIID